MRILVLVPLDGRHAAEVMSIRKNLTAEENNHICDMVNFIDYLLNLKVVNTYNEAFRRAINGLFCEYESSVKSNSDLIVFGNAPKKLKFDAVFTWQGGWDKDLVIEQYKEIFHDNQEALELFDFYGPSDSKFILDRVEPTAGFLRDYLQTDPHLEKIREKYKDKLKFKE